MRIGKKFRYAAAAFLMLLSTVTPMGGALLRNAYAADDVKPVSGKSIRPNGDGTYTISLNVKGVAKTETTSTKANVIVVFDTSGSMDSGTGVNAFEERTYGRYGLVGGEYVQLYYSDRWGNHFEVQDNDNHSTVYYWSETENNFVGYTSTRYAQVSQKRLDVAKTALNSLAEKLLSNNIPSTPDAIEMAFIDFSTHVNSTSAKTTSINDFKSWVNATTASGGTNWEEALDAADNFSFNDNDKTYVIFISDGNPTFRASQNGYNDWSWQYQAWGNGRSDPNSRNYNAAKVVADRIVGNANKELFSVGVFGDATNMQNIGGTYKDATDQAALNAAFDDIVNKITNSLNLEDITFTDGITEMTSIAAVEGQATGFKYFIKEKDDATEREWTDISDANKAKLVDGHVVWKLDSLSEGAEARVEFIVWPDQDSYDLVAALNNHEATYDEETMGGSIVDNGDGTYSLKTNKKDPKLEYTVVTKKYNAAGELISEDRKDGSTILDNPDPVALDDQRVIISKQWDDTLDQSQAAKIDSIKFNLYRDNKDTVYKNFELKKSDGWKGSEISIAPGVMVSANSATAAVLKTSGNTYREVGGYLILETGHDYWFEEITDSTSSYAEYLEHFDLTKYFYHPMLVDGHLKNVIFNEDGSLTIEDFDEDKGLYAENTLKGGININKKIINEDNTEITDSEDKFDVTVYLKNPDDNNTDHKYDYRIFCTKSHDDCTEALSDGSGYRSGHKYGTGTIRESIHTYDTIRVVNVDTGTLFHVEEGDKIGYDLESIQYTIAEGKNSAQPYGDSKKIDGKDYYAVAGNSASAAVITNKYTSGSLKISKTVEGNPVIAKNFTFTVKLFGADGAELTDGSYSYTGSKSGTIKSGQTVELANGENITIAGLPEGARYEVTEAEMTGYATTKTGNTGTIVKNETAEAKFTNTYSTSGTIKIEAKKQFNNWLDTDSFEFVLKDSTNKTVDTQTISSSTQSAKFNVPIAAAGTYTYKIEETQNFRRGIQNITNTEGHVLTVTVVAVDKGDGTLDTSNVKYWSDLDTITNEYTASGSVTFAATKMLTGRDWANQESFAFTIYGADENYNANTNVFGNGTASAANAGADGSSAITFDKIEYSLADAGKTYYYVIKETSDLTNTGLTNSGDLGAKVEITDNHDGTLSTTVTYSNGQVVTNTYAANGEVVLKATKTLTGRHWKDGESYTFVLQDAQGKAVNDADGNPIQATVSQNGEVTFPALKYTEADIKTGTFNYVITETGDLTANGLTKSNDINVTVTVAVDGTDASKLNVTASYDNNDTITNTYAATGSATLEATKKFAGAAYDWSGKEFEFVLSGNDTSESKKVTEAEPKATFSAINYTLADAGKTYTYTISETDPGLAGVTASKPIEVKVAVVDNGNGTLTATPTYTNGNEITNTYATKSTTATLHVEKKIDDQSNSNANGVFEFTLSDGKGYSDTKSIDTSKTSGVDFDVITYTEAGVYEYTLQEVAGNAEGFSYDTTEYKVTVTVMDDPETAQLSATVAYGEAKDLTITNTYKATATSIKFEVTKTLNGMNEGIDPVDFNFTLSGAAGEIETITIHGAGKKEFKEISYDKAGTYEYTVVEKNGGAGGYSYDNATYTIKVEVKDEGGVLKATPTITKNGESASEITFENNYSAKGNITLQVNKVLDGRNWLEGETHTFILKDSEGKQVGEAKAVTAEGIISFDEIEYTKAGTYTYKVEEVLGADYQDGSLTPADPITVTVTVADDGAGNLTATPSYGDTAPTMTNTYTATGSVTINVTKNLEGRDWLEGESFTFALYDSEGNQIGDSKTVTKDSATANFTVEYTQADTEESKDGTAEITYTVKEISEMPANIAQPDDLTVTVSLKDDGHGTIEATTDQEDGYTITNEYVPTPTNAQFHVEKEIDDRSNSGANGEFTFVLKDADGNELESKTINTNKETGVDFTSIQYAKAGTYNYTITERVGDAAGYTYDRAEHAVVVTVTDDNAGTLTATVTYDGKNSLVITNVYEAKPVNVNIDVEKTIYGIENVDSDKLPTFEFELTGDNVDGTMTTTITGEGEASFEAITFTKVGTYTLTVHEVEGNAPGYIYDDNDVTVTVVVTDNNGQLEAEVSYKKGLAEGLETAIFTNGYEAEIVEDYEIVVKKMLEGRKLDEGEFKFELVNTDGEVVATGTNDADGNVVFSGISFEAVGKYNFLVREIVDANRGEIDFDTNEYEVEIVVVDNSEGQLVVESDTSSEVIFKNKYNEPGKGENPQTSDDILSVVATLIISAIGLIGAMFYGFRSKEENEA